MGAMIIGRNFLRIGFLLCFLITIAISVLLRIYPLIRQPSLNSPYVIDPDSARFVRQARLIVERGTLPEVDAMRWQPVGRRSADQLTLHSYLLASLYKIIHKFKPEWALEQFAALYPVIVSTLCWCVLYLVIKELSDALVALMSLNMIVVMPIMVARSVAGYVDRDALSLLLGSGLYFFYLRACRHQSRVRYVYQLISGCIAGVLALTWHGVGLFLSVIVCAEWLRLIFVGYRRADWMAYVLWFVPYFLCLFLKKSVYFQSTSGFTLLAVGVPLLFLIVTITYGAISASDRLTTLFSWHGQVSIGTSISLVFLVGMSLCGISVYAYLTPGSFDILYRITAMLKPFGTSRLAKTILELTSSDFVLWMVWPGIFFLAIIAGASLLVSRLADNLQIDRWLSMTFVQVVIGGITYTELIPKHLSSAVRWADSIYALCLLAIPSGALLGSIFSWKRAKSVALDGNALFLLCWLFITLVCARGGLRFHFFFIPVAISIGVYALVALLRYLFGSRYAIAWFCMVIGLISSELWTMRDLLL